MNAYSEGSLPPIKLQNATFITSAASESQFIKTAKTMIAVCGKSNVGKSTFINMLANQKRLAKTSAAPGRTRLVNYFDFGPFVLADLPGYGYAEVSKTEKAKWAKTLDSFFARSEALSHVFVLLDCRHDPTADDLQMLQYLNYHVVPFTAVLTKSDKLSKMKLKEQTVKIAAKAGLAAANMLVTSGETKTGRDAVLQKIAQIIALSKETYDQEDESDETEEELLEEKTDGAEA